MRRKIPTGVARITGIARSTIGRGLAELRDAASSDVVARRVRRPGGGRKKLTATDPTLLSDLRGLVEPATRGDPQAPPSVPMRMMQFTLGSLHSMARKDYPDDAHAPQADRRTRR